MTRLIALAGIITISFSAIFVRLADVAPATAGLFRVVYALPVLSILAVRTPPRPRRLRILAFISGLLLAGDIALWHTSIDLIGAGVGNITAHEAGHFFANWHTDQFNPVANIMDQGGNLPGLVGVGPDGIFGTADDVDVDFGKDTFVPNEGFTGVEDTLNTIAFGATTPEDDDADLMDFDMI